MLKSCVLIGLTFLLATDDVLAQSPIPSLSTSSSRQVDIDDPRLGQRIEALLRRMTLEEKIGQLTQYSEGQPIGPGTGRTDYHDMIARGQIGALLNFGTAKETNAYQRTAVTRSRLGIPLLFGLDVVHGFRTVFPIPLGLASTWDPGLVERAARVAAREASASGIRWTFSPMVDIARDPRWGRIAESAGEDPFLGSQLAAAYVRGYQGSRLDAPDSIAACAKHFVGYGAAEGGRDYNTTEISEHTLREIYLPPFQAAVNAGAATMMSAFNALNGIPASANPFTLTQILRHEWGFHGFVDSDWGSIQQLVTHGVAWDDATAAYKAFSAGVDMDMASGIYQAHLSELIRSGQITEARLEESVRHVLRIKFALGLFERPYVDESREAQAMLRPDAISLARAAAERSLVLLKNEQRDGKPLLPLPSSVRVALVGPRADDGAGALAASPAQGRGDDITSLREALAQRLGHSRFIYVKDSGTESDIDAAVNAARRADVVLCALGEANDMSGEAASRAHLTLPLPQQQLLEAMMKSGKPIVLVLFSGRPLALPWAFEHVNAAIAAWFPGIQGGPALVRTLFGDSNPSGRLVTTWPRTVGQVPSYYNALNTGSPLRLDAEGREVRYSSRYIDEHNSPQFPFGYGLSYTKIRYSAPELSTRQLHAATLNALLSTAGATALTAAADVTNTGSVAATEVVQVYVRLEATSTAQPVRALKGFQRISLAPGETKKVTFSLAPATFAIWSIDNHYRVEPARVTVWISPDSASGSSTGFEILP